MKFSNKLVPSKNPEISADISLPEMLCMSPKRHPNFCLTHAAIFTNFGPSAICLCTPIMIAVVRLLLCNCHGVTNLDG
jgi:hypothetical protein